MKLRIIIPKYKIISSSGGNNVVHKTNIAFIHQGSITINPLFI